MVLIALVLLLARSTVLLNLPDLLPSRFSDRMVQEQCKTSSKVSMQLPACI